MTVDETRPRNREEMRILMREFSSFNELADTLNVPVSKLISVSRNGYINKSLYKILEPHGEFVDNSRDIVPRVDNTKALNHNKKEMIKLIKMHGSVKKLSNVTGVATGVLCRVRNLGYVSKPTMDKLEAFCKLKPVSSKDCPILATVEFTDVDSVREENMRHPIKDEFLEYMVEGLLLRDISLRPCNEKI